MDKRRAEISAKALSILWLFVALLFGISSSAWAFRWIDDFNIISRQGITEDEDWDWTGTLDSTHTADATDRAGRISPGTTSYTTETPTDGDWGTTDNFIGLYIWGSGGLETLSIVITEEDPDNPTPPPPANPTNEVWTLDTDPATFGNQPQTVNWTGWKYKMYKLPDDFTPSGGNGTWDPVYMASNPPSNFEIRGAIQIDLILTGPNAVYIDEITLCNSGTKTGWVTLIFPTDDISDTGIDITLDRLPPTISAVLGTSADVTNGNTNIYVIQENPFESSNSYPTEDLIVLPNDVRDDGDNGLFATPNDTTAAGTGAYLPGGVFTVFIRPVDSDGNYGMAEVITFSVSSPGTAVGTEYHREVTE